MPSEEKALGRGLEDISHLFLSGSRDPQAQKPVDSEVSPRSATRNGVAVLRPGAGLTKHQLTATLVECQDALESGIRVLDENVSCSPFGEIDVLALDRFNRWTIIDVETTLTDALLVRGLGHLDWVARNVTHLRRMYPAPELKAGSPPHLVLVAPAFSTLIRSALRQLGGVAVACFTYRSVAISDRIAIFVERDRNEEAL